MLEQRPSVVSQLDEELLSWLTTVNGDNQPQTSPVWHVRDGDELIVYSRVDATRLENLEANSRVSFNLRGDRRGDTIVTLEGTAVVDSLASTPLGAPAYMAKYGDEITRLGWTPEQYDQEFPVALRITVTRVRAW